MPLVSYFMLKNDKVDSVKYFFFVYFLYIGPFLPSVQRKIPVFRFFLLLITIDSYIIITNNIIQYLTLNS